MRVHDVMTTTVVTITPDASFQEMVDLMIRLGVSGLPVVDAERRLVGMVTEADLISKEAYGGHRRRALEVVADLVAGGSTRWVTKAKGSTAGEVMATNVLTVRPGETIEAAARRMVEGGVKRLPVVEGDRLVGIVARTDLLRAMHRADDDIAADVRLLLADPLRAPDHHEVSATVRDGVVTLSGAVEFPHDVSLLAAMVWHLPGVVDVSSHVISRFPEPRPVS